MADILRIIKIMNSEQCKSTKIEWEEPKTKPFLKWAGGKLKVVPLLKKKFPKNGARFIEPFVGAGAVSLNVDYPSFIINDANSDLIFVWQELQTHGMDFVEECKKMFTPQNNCREAFDDLKKEFNKSKNKLRRATLFVYLNRHCFNGLCRYNGSGGFNVPFGKYESPYFPQEEFEKCYEKVKRFDLYNKDFREIFKMVEKDDVVYCDPPYFPLSESANFDSYSVGGFSLKDHLDLAAAAENAANKGAIVVISNHYSWYSRQLYAVMHNGKISSMDVARTISSNTEERDSVKEITAVFKKDINEK